jgi:hypothetical protein
MRLPVVLTLLALSAPLSLARAQDAAFMAELQQVIESATAERLPADAIRERVAAGAAYNADRTLILKVARIEFSRLMTARQLLGAGAPDLDITAGARALSVKGFPSSSIVAVRKARPVGSVSVPLGILAELVQQNANPKRATDWLVRLMQRQATDVQLAAYSAEVQKNITDRKLDPNAALDVHMRYVAALPGTVGTGGQAAEALQLGPPVGATNSDPGLKSTLPTTVKPPGGKPPR